MNLEFKDIVPIVSIGGGPGEHVDIADVVRFYFVTKFNFLFILFVSFVCRVG